jgi:WD40 repeat protein
VVPPGRWRRGVARWAFNRRARLFKAGLPGVAARRGRRLFSVRFDPKGQRLVTGGSGDRRAIVWDTEPGRPTLKLRHPRRRRVLAAGVGGVEPGRSPALGAEMNPATSA